VADRESDIYAGFARRPASIDLIVRAAQDRVLDDGGRLFAAPEAWPELARTEVRVAPSRTGVAADVIDPGLLPAADAIGPTLEGKTPRQKTPHPPRSLAWLGWIIARLGGWNCYYKPPGPKTMRAGWASLASMATGFIIAAQSNA
jgi:hypothetical protein